MKKQFLVFTLLLATVFLSNASNQQDTQKLLQTMQTNKNNNNQSLNGIIEQAKTNTAMQQLKQSNNSTTSFSNQLHQLTKK